MSKWQTHVGWRSVSDTVVMCQLYSVDCEVRHRPAATADERGEEMLMLTSSPRQYLSMSSMVGTTNDLLCFHTRENIAYILSQVWWQTVPHMAACISKASDAKAWLTSCHKYNSKLFHTCRAAAVKLLSPKHQTVPHMLACISKASDAKAWLTSFHKYNSKLFHTCRAATVKLLSPKHCLCLATSTMENLSIHANLQ